MPSLSKLTACWCTNLRLDQWCARDCRWKPEIPSQCPNGLNRAICCEESLRTFAMHAMISESTTPRISWSICWVIPWLHFITSMTIQKLNNWLLQWRWFPSKLLHHYHHLLFRLLDSKWLVCNFFVEFHSLICSGLNWIACFWNWREGRSDQESCFGRCCCCWRRRRRQWKRQEERCGRCSQEDACLSCQSWKGQSPCMSETVFLLPRSFNFWEKGGDQEMIIVFCKSYILWLTSRLEHVFVLHDDHHLFFCYFLIVLLLFISICDWFNLILMWMWCCLSAGWKSAQKWSPLVWRLPHLPLLQSSSLLLPLIALW